jgi:hypothetical protein
VQSSHAESGVVPSPAVETDQRHRRRHRRWRHRSSSPCPPPESGSSAAGIPSRLPAHATLGPTDDHVEPPHSWASCKAPHAFNVLSLADHTSRDGTATSSPVPQVAMELWPAGDRCDAAAQKDPSGSLSRLLLPFSTLGARLEGEDPQDRSGHSPLGCSGSDSSQALSEVGEQAGVSPSSPAV